MLSYEGLTVITSNKVYLPAEDSFLAAEVLEECLLSSKQESLEVLDMGAGTGILGLLAAKSKKVRSVLFADVNPDAVTICNDNISFNSAVLKAQCSAIKSDLFSKVKGNFDIILFNAPYLKNEQGDEKHGDISKAWAGGEEGIEISIRFLNEAVNHLKEHGKILLVASSLSNIEKLKQEIKNAGLKEDKQKKIHVFFEDIIVYVLSKN